MRARSSFCSPGRSTRPRRASTDWSTRSRRTRKSKRSRASTRSRSPSCRRKPRASPSRCSSAGAPTSSPRRSRSKPSISCRCCASPRRWKTSKRTRRSASRTSRASPDLPSAMTAAEQRPQPTIAIIGAGFAGLGMGYYLKQAGLNNFTIFEKAQDLGGVWRENTYPGAACDVPSHLYSFSFEPHYPWSRAYGPQKDIFAYQHMVAKKYGILGKIRFGREVLGAEFDEARGVWTIWFSDETSFEAHVLISAVGQLHRPSFPPVEGIEKFKGVQFHSANWNHDFEFFGKTVASIGTGPSAIQYVPEI